MATRTMQRLREAIFWGQLKTSWEKLWPERPPPALPPFCLVRRDIVDIVAEEVVLFGWAAGCLLDIAISTESTTWALKAHFLFFTFLA